MAYVGQGIKNGTFAKLDTSGNTYNGSNVTFALGTQVGSPVQLLVSHDGVIQNPGTDYTLASNGTQITFTTAPASGASIFIMEISGAVGGPMNRDINGEELILDVDGDTSITADTDDQIDIKIAGADDFAFKANKFEVQTGSNVDMNGTELILDADGDTSITADTDDQIDFKIAGADDLKMTANAINVLSGTTLTIDSGATITNSGTANGFGTDPDGAQVFNESSADVDFRVESNGNTHMFFIDGGNNMVNVGADGGGQLLNVVGANAQTYDQTLTHAIALAMPGLEIQNTNATDGNGSCISFIDGGGFMNAAMGVSHEDHDTNGNGYLFFATRTTDTGADTVNERMRIGSNGSVAIGKIAVDSTILKVQGSTDSEKMMQLRHGDADNPNGMQIQYFGGAPDGSGDDFYSAQDTGATRFEVTSDGDVRNHDNSYGATSDQRIKQNITDSGSQWDDIKAVKVRKYKKKDDVRQYGDKAWEQIGVIAQELEASGMDKLIREGNPSEADIISDSSFGTLVDDTDNPIVYLPKDSLPAGKKINDPVLDESGNPTYYKKVGEVKAKVKSIGYSVLYMKAIKALQEAQTRIETLETKVKALEDA